MLFETTRLGGVVSGASSEMTVTVNVPVPSFPAASVAVQVTVVVPTEKLEPEGGEQVGPEVTPTSSDAVTVNVIVLPAELEVEPVRLDGTVTTGGVVSAPAGGAGTVNVEESEPLNVGSQLGVAQSQMIVYVPPVQSSGIGMLQEVVIGADWYHVTSQVALLQ